MTIYNAMPPESRVWIYQSETIFTNEQVETIKKSMQNFIAEWSAHGKKLQAWGNVFYQQFIVLLVNEAQAQASGCSIDSSVHWIKGVEKQLGVTLFNRLLISYMENEEVKTVNRQEFITRLKNGIINKDTMVFNNLVSTKEAFETQWKLPLRKSWQAQLYQSF